MTGCSSTADDPKKAAPGGDPETSTSQIDSSSVLNGEVSDYEYIIQLPEGERVGLFSGNLVNGKPEGEGTFKSQNSEGLAWTYTGNFQDGKFNGFGKTVFDDENSAVKEGTYVNNVFTPNKAEFFEHYKQYYSPGGNVSQKAVNFITDHPDLFPALTPETQEQTRSLLNPTITEAELLKNISNYGDQMVQFDNQKIVQVFEDHLFNYDVTWILADNYESDGQYRTMMYYFPGKIDVFEGSVINVIGLPFAYGSFENVSGGTTIGIDLVASIIQVVG